MRVGAGRPEKRPVNRVTEPPSSEARGEGGRGAGFMGLKRSSEATAGEPGWVSGGGGRSASQERSWHAGRWAGAVVGRTRLGCWQDGCEAGRTGALHPDSCCRIGAGAGERGSRRRRMVRCTRLRNGAAAAPSHPRRPPPPHATPKRRVHAPPPQPSCARCAAARPRPHGQTQEAPRRRRRRRRHGRRRQLGCGQGEGTAGGVS
jgi:hypothetical protein